LDPSSGLLASLHAARRKAIRGLLLDDVDLGNRRLTIGGRVRPVDDLTRQVLLEWLSHRNARWPCTANPHLLINQMSANGTGPVSTSQPFMDAAYQDMGRIPGYRPEAPGPAAPAELAQLAHRAAASSRNATGNDEQP
jgi:hypothetical protein